MNKNYVIIGIVMIVIAFLSQTNGFVYNLFMQIFGVMFFVASYIIGLLGFIMIIIGLIQAGRSY